MPGPRNRRESRPTGERRSQRPPRRYLRPAADAARLAAFSVLRAVDEEDAYANLFLPSLLRHRGIEGRDAAFATELAYGTLRGRGTYDAVLAACVDRPLEQVDPPVLDVLRLGAHQLLGMRTATHAAVSATVELARAVLGDGRAKFVNAVLRRVSRQDLDAWLAEVAPDAAADPVGHLSVTRSHPRWIVSALRDALGGSLEETDILLAADNAPAAVTLVARPGRSTVDELVEAGAQRSPYSPYGARWAPGGDPRAVPAVAEGRAGVQDEGSQLVALALARVDVSGEEHAWLDLCAGPGGKAALLAALARERGVALIAAELAPHRARLVKSSLGTDFARSAAAVVADGRRPAWAPGIFDRVLVDAPCTGLGALRRRPEARWRRSVDDVPVLGALQRDLLGSALDAVRHGGVVAYVTCSPHLAESRVVVADLLRKHDDVERLDARTFLPEVPDLGPGPDVQLWPHRHGTDAMYLALLRRR